MQIHLGWACWMLQALDANGDTIILGLQDPSPHWLPGALGPPQTQSCGNKSSCWCWRHQRQALPDRVTCAVPSPTAKATVTAPSSAPSRPVPAARSALENDFDPAILTEKEMCLLLAAVMNDYVQMKTSELKQETEHFHITAQKRSCNRATCVTHKMAGSLSRSGSEIKRNFMSTNVGSKAFGQRSRDLQN
uniref:Calcitonin receptor-stimulating peptide-2 n=1 Tax=Capra hircus TaxID=9925 RepID=A0A8C2S5A6_CAPHI